MSLPGGAVAVVVISFIFCPLALLALVSRLWSRRIMKLKLCLNDFAAILAMTFTVGTTSVYLAAVFAAGLGVHVKNVPLHKLALHEKLYVPTQLLWGASNSCVKLSILDLYTKIFPKPAFRKICYTTMALTLCYFLTVFLETFLMCRPFAFSWDRTVPGGTCANTNLAYMFSGITNLLIDALVVTLPMPMLWGLHLPKPKKMELAGMFGFGYIICVISLKRILWLKSWDQTDFTYTASQGVCLSILEPALGVVNACLPTIRPVLDKVSNIDVLTWVKGHRKNSAIENQLRHNRTRSSSSPDDSGRNNYLPLKDLPASLTKPQISARSAHDERIRLDVVKPDNHAIQVTRTFDVDITEGDSHHV